MARRLNVGMVLATLVFTGGSRVSAGPTPIYPGADVRFTVAATPKESSVMAEGLGVRVSKRVGATVVKVRIEAAKDIVEVEANAKGIVHLERRGQVVDINMASRDPKALAKARRMMDGSAALKSFDALIVALEGDQRAVAKSLVTTWALINVARGVDEAVAIATRRMTAAAQPFTRVKLSMAREETPAFCWAEYASTVYTYYMEYADCVNNYAWLPGMAGVCSFEWLVKVELAWFWVLSCSGGMPV